MISIYIGKRVRIMGMLLSMKSMHGRTNGQLTEQSIGTNVKSIKGKKMKPPIRVVQPHAQKKQSVKYAMGNMEISVSTNIVPGKTSMQTSIRESASTTKLILKRQTTNGMRAR